MLIYRILPEASNLTLSMEDFYINVTNDQTSDVSYDGSRVCKTAPDPANLTENSVALIAPSSRMSEGHTTVTQRGFMTN